MTTPDPATPSFPCDTCGYDLRAQPIDGKCPECNASVAESRRLALIPRRPAWRDSDPRWRRRMLAGVWVLVFVPLMAVLTATGFADTAVVPTPLPLRGDLNLQDTFAEMTYVYLTFCIGIVLLFSKERHRRSVKLDWTRRWGIITSYLVFLLGIPYFAFVTSLVLVGIGALFHSLPLQSQPASTELFTRIGAAYLLHGPPPTLLSELSLHAFSSAVVMLACVPLYNALRSITSKPLAMLLLSPLFTASLLHLADVCRHALGAPIPYPNSLDGYYPFYFDTDLLIKGYHSITLRFFLEAAKWSACFIIALWLTLAQITAWRWGPLAHPSSRPTSRTPGRRRRGWW